MSVVHKTPRWERVWTNCGGRPWVPARSTSESAKGCSTHSTSPSPAPPEPAGQSCGPCPSRSPRPFVQGSGPRRPCAVNPRPQCLPTLESALHPSSRKAPWQLLLVARGAAPPASAEHREVELGYLGVTGRCTLRPAGVSHSHPRGYHCLIEGLYESPSMKGPPAVPNPCPRGLPASLPPQRPSLSGRTDPLAPFLSESPAGKSAARDQGPFFASSPLSP